MHEVKMMQSVKERENMCICCMCVSDFVGRNCQNMQAIKKLE